MYAPNETQAGEAQAGESQAAAVESERPQMGQGEARYGFRPLALPALAAAATLSKTAPRDRVQMGAGTRQGILRLVHEDEPQD